MALLAFAVCFVLAVPARAQAVEDRPPIPVEQALRGPERRDIPWEIRILPPRLTFQQRNLVELKIGVDPAGVHKRVEQRDLYFVVKVADAEGKWLPGEDYFHYPLAHELDRKQELQFVAGIYMRPGTYTVAALLYDSLSEELNVARKTVEVAPVKHDPLPQLDRDLPEVEFLPEVPRDTPGEQTPGPQRIPPFRSRRFPAGRLPRGAFGSDANETWALGAGHEWLPVSNARPLRVDIVLNFARSEDPQARQESLSAYRQNAGAVLQIGSVLSHLGVKKGCVRVSGVDVLRMHKVFEDADAAEMDWRKMSRAILQADRTTVDVGTLAGRTRASAFFHEFLTKLFSEGGCGSERTGERVVIVVGSDMEFASGTKVEQVAEDTCTCRLYYLSLPMFNAVDQIDRMLKPMKPRRFRINDPHQFRRALSDIVRDLGPAAADQSR